MQLRDILKQVDPDGFAKVELLSGRPPRVVRGDSFQPLSREALSDDEVLELCRQAGAGGLIDRVSATPASWSFQGVRGPCVGTVALRGREVLATFTARPQPAAATSRDAIRRDSKQAAGLRVDDPRAERRTKPPRKDSRTLRPPEQAAARAERAPPSARDRPTRDNLRAARSERPPREATAADRPRVAERTRSTEPPPSRAKETSPEGTLRRVPSPAEAKPTGAHPQRDADDVARMRRAVTPRPAARAAVAPAAEPAPPPNDPPRTQGAGASAADQLLLRLLRQATQRRASDLHVSAGSRAEARVCGALVQLDEPPPNEAAIQRVVQSITSSAQRAELDRSGSVSFARTIDGVRARVNVAQTLAGPKLALRLLDAEPRALADLGLPTEVSRAIEHHQGLVLVTGPSGHGKTTTLAALVDTINAERAAHVITVEDPIEIPIASKRSMISQREVGTQTASFERALKGSLRQDPDVIVVGELRDTTTVQMALSAAETGHLVLGTMNTPTTAATIDRLIGLFPPADQPQIRATLANALRLVLNQRLVPTADGTSRVAACELLPGSLALANLIRDDKLHQLASLMQRGRGAGILRLAESVQDLVRAGTVKKSDVEHLLPPEIPPAPPPNAPKEERMEEPSEEGLGGLLARAGTLWRRGS